MSPVVTRSCLWVYLEQHALCCSAINLNSNQKTFPPNCCPFVHMAFSRITAPKQTGFVSISQERWSFTVFLLILHKIDRKPRCLSPSWPNRKQEDIPRSVGMADVVFLWPLETRLIKPGIRRSTRAIGHTDLCSPSTCCYWSFTSLLR